MISWKPEDTSKNEGRCGAFYGDGFERAPREEFVATTRVRE
jgi:hypothetical protein